MSDTLFDRSPCPAKHKLDNFSKYVPRQKIARFMAQMEVFKLQQGVKGSIVECGVHQGGGLMTWAKLSSILEPYNYHREIIGFDTFTGSEGFNQNDAGTFVAETAPRFDDSYDVHAELQEVIKDYDSNRFISHIPKIELVKGDATQTIPAYLEKNQHLIISLLYLDFTIYQPTIGALQALLPRIPKGGIIGFNEMNNPHWPGETRAVLETLNLNNFELRCFPYEPNLSYIQL